MKERSKDCPSCGEHGPQWIYDFQICKVCGYNRMVVEMQDITKLCASKDTDLNERASRIEQLNTKQREIME